MQSQRERAEAGEILSPRVFLSAGMIAEEHGVDGMWERATDPEDPQSVAPEVASLVATGADVIKIRFHNPPLDARVSEASHALGVPLTSHYIFLSTLARGLEGKEHASLYYRDFTAIYRDDVLSALAAGNVCLTPTLVVFPWQLGGRSTLFPLDSTFLNDPALAVLNTPRALARAREALRRPPSDRTLQFGDGVLRVDLANVRRLEDAGVRLATGTDVPAPWREHGVHLEMELLVMAGLTPLEAIRAATLDAARCLGVERDLGSVEVGKFADLIVVDGDPATDIRDTRRIRWVVLGGRLLSREEILDSVRPAGGARPTEPR